MYEYVPINSNYFDLVICQGVLDDLKNPQLAIVEMWRILKNHGLL